MVEVVELVTRIDVVVLELVVEEVLDVGVEADEE